ncbi:hypothetical protein RD055328_10200, partial [Companilactobacillus sp. RD055328]|uniref:LPXTG cell wall anchor domain-containing protein n=1 Tax=Companilactobacillus sp. RD055328 TaxID=2916634 RepID=UPI001FC8B768
TTFSAIATMPDGTEKSALVSPDGSFAITVDPMVANEEISVKIKATNGEYTKDSAPTTMTVKPMEDTNPLEDYTVAKPTVEVGTEGDTSVIGAVELETPIPDGTTFSAIATMPDGTEKSALVSPDGSFAITVDPMVANEEISVKIKATNGEYTKDSAPTKMTVKPMEDTNPLEDYTVAIPSVNPAKSGDTSVSGHVDLETPIPDGTTFEASVTMPDGTIKTAVVDSNGDFTIATDALVALDELSVKVTAKNGNYTKDSLPVIITVSDDTNENPLEDYTVAKPTVDPVTDGDTSVTGSVDLETPIPDGTTFEAVVTMPDGTQKVGPVVDGKFKVDTGLLKEGDELSVEVIAKNGDYEKPSEKVQVKVASKDDGISSGGGDNSGSGTDQGASNAPGKDSGSTSTDEGRSDGTRFASGNDVSSADKQNGLPQTGEKSGIILSALGILVLASIVFFKKLVPFKKE